MARQTTFSAEEGALAGARRGGRAAGQLTGQQWTTLESLTSFAAHEIRNPLAAMRATVELAMATHDAERRNALLRRVIDCIDELSDFLTELLISAGPDGIGLVPLELQPLVVGVIRLFSVQAEVMNVCIKLDAPPALPPVWGNAPLLRQVVMNLVKNALEAMPDGGLLRVTLLSPSRDTVRMEVADTGRGIPKTYRDHLFSGLDVDRPGHGVGLRFVYRVVTHIHRGRIWFDTEEGVGTTFYVELPAAGTAGGLPAVS